MTDNDQIITEIIEGDLKTLYHLLQPIKEESPELMKAYRKLKYGVNIKTHIRWLIDNLYNERPRTGDVELQGKWRPLEELWDEEEEREAIARKALLEHYQQDDEPYAGR